MLYIRLLRPVLHFILILFVFYIVYNLRSITDGIPFVHLNIPYINFEETMFFGLVVSIFFPIFGLINGLYKLYGPIHNYYNKFFKVFVYWVVFITFFAYFGHGYIFLNGISRLIIIWGGILSFILMLFLDFILNFINSKLEEKKPYKIGVYKTSFFKDIKDKFKNYNIYTLYEFEKIEDIGNFDIIFMVGNLETSKIEDIMDFARIKQKQVYHIPDVNFLEDILYHQERIGPIISWKYKPSPLEGWYRVFKRIFDIVFSLLFIILFWWVYILIALRIYFHDRGNVIYISERVGQGGKKIKVYKFRTMVKDADKMKEKLLEKNERDDVLFKIENDPRIKSWGKILRKTSLDEIPQFFNVLKGDMSIAGPRPHLEEEVKKYKKWQKRLLAAKPGITGYAQVFARDLPFEEEAKLDLYRFINWSIWMDVIVILGVFKVLFKGK